VFGCCIVQCLPVIDHMPAEWSCHCAVCSAVRAEDGRPEVGRLNTEALKRHFLLCRHAEFERADQDFDADVSNLSEVGQWVVDNETDLLPESHGLRLLVWADALTP